ncbi:hypothetical protein MMC20_002663 [Loxospora ochrophaea]|nr:hypothetical protein [Loxospora ochrophaea]
MPSFYHPAVHRQMSLTPPDHYGAYANSSSGGIQASAMPYYGHNALSAHYGVNGPDKFDYGKQSVHSTTQGRVAATKDFDRQSASSFLPPLAPIEDEWLAAAAPPTLLPPIRTADQPYNPDQHFASHLQVRTAQSQPQQKEQKVVGGVAAHLDYEMEDMVDFVSEMAQGMYDLYHTRICLADIDIIRSVHPNISVPPAFRKYVSQILSSTRLPSSTILLGLSYLVTRMNMLSASGRYSSGTGQVYRMLTTALLLGSKFLDDNTFQNRSWSEVSSIPVSELNTLEIEWLVAIRWDLHIHPDDPQGLSVWINHWKTWKAKKVESALNSLKLTPLDASLQRQHAANKRLSIVPPYLPSYSDSTYGLGRQGQPQSRWQTPRHDQWPAAQPLIEHSPPSAPDTGPNTPDWYGRFNGMGFGHGIPTYTTRTIPPPSQILTSATQAAAYQTNYAPQYSNWTGHGMGCVCAYCLPHHDHYAMAHGYGAQPVVG